MRGVAVIGDLEAHAGLEDERESVAQFDPELAFKHIQDVAAIAPMVGEIARPIFDDAHAQVASLERPRRGMPGIAGLHGRRNGGPVGHGEGQLRKFHSLRPSDDAWRRPSYPAATSPIRITGATSVKLGIDRKSTPLNSSHT